MIRHIIILLLSLCLAPISIGQEGEPWFEPNRGQWDGRILYKVGLQKGEFFIEKDKFTYALNNLGDIHHAAHTGKGFDTVKHHTVHSHFINSSWQGEVIESDSSSFYKNYILGRDKSKWQSKVKSVQSLRFIDYYPGIDLIMKIDSKKIKYSFEVAPGIDPSIIQIYYEGMEELVVDKDQIEIKTRFGSIYEKDLKVWSISQARQIEVVNTEFSLLNDTVSYHFPDGYDPTSKLVIDPSLTFSTFTGSTADNWGFTAAPDDDANLYAGGIVFGTGYPISTGAFDNTFNGGYGFNKIDMGISKFSSDGSSLLYSTYIGGNGNETPHSIVTNSQGELFILGATTSTNFPVAANAFQTTHNGGTLTQQIAIKFDGSDIVLAKLSADGTTLNASTLLGGSKNDGLNVSALNYNYGDVFRGEVILDDNGDVLIASVTQSLDFPIVNGSNTSLGGVQDAIVAKFNPDLTNLIWSTYLGGSSLDAGYSIQVSSTNDIYVSGGTNSNDFPATGGHKTNYQGGLSDGFIVKMDGTTSNVISGTYIGTAQYDQSFFVQIDQSDRIYSFGQTAGSMTVSPGVYSNPNSGQFIHQYSSDLSTLNWSTIVGGGNGVVEISPTAFLVSNCNEIYYTGWGGVVNQTIQASGSTSNGFPTTANAHQSNTNGNNFYIGVLSEDAAGLNYGTFMGGVSSSTNHVDGGTSRFDKQGRIYHAVCGACGGDPNGFTTTPGAYATNNASSNCNLAAWKFDLGAIVSAMSVPATFICEGDTTFFSNNSQNADIFFWDFGDGNTSTAFEPSHIYGAAGTYEVMFVVSASDGCFEPDTSYLTLEVGDFNGAVVNPSGEICPGEDYQLQASGGSVYDWSPTQFLDDPTLPNPTANIDTTTTFTVIISDSCGSDTLEVTLEVLSDSSNSIADIEICKGDTVSLWVSGGNEYNWTSSLPGSIIGPNDIDSILISPDFDASYEVDIITAEGCTLVEQVEVIVFQSPPQPIVPDTVFVCEGEKAVISVSDAPTIVWSPNIDIDTIQGPHVVISTIENRWYYIDFTNPCGTVRDSVYINIVGTYPAAGNDTIVCPGDTVQLWASGGEEYEWKPPYSLSSPNSANTSAYPNNPTNYTVFITDKYGCKSSASVKVDHFPEPFLQVSADYYGFEGDEVQLNAQSNNPGGSYKWSPPNFLSCTDCKNPVASPPSSITYFVTYEDENGCRAKEEVEILFEGIIYVPNTFTPDGDGNNDVFYVVGGNIREFHLEIFDRWGEIIFESFDLNGVWNGSYGNKICKDGTYVWKITYEDIEGVKKEMVGHVNLLR